MIGPLRYRGFGSLLTADVLAVENAELTSVRAAIRKLPLLMESHQVA
jgi:hypothetical protein